MLMKARVNLLHKTPTMNFRILSLAFLVFFGFACTSDTTSKDSSAQETKVEALPVLASLEIKGMVCAMGCAKSIETKLNETEGIIACTVDFGKEEASIEFDPNTISQQELVAVVEEMHDGQFDVVKVKASDKKKKPSATSGSSSKDEALFEMPAVKFPNIFDIIGNFYSY